MEESVFALGPYESFIYWTPTRTRRRNLPADLEATLAKASRIYWAAFGPGEENYVVSYVNAVGGLGLTWGDSTPADLVLWLVGENRDTIITDAQLRVTLGPDDSFFAWDSKRVRWQNIPAGLEKAVQRWLGPAGWNSGPPRIVTIGTHGAYFAASTYGVVAYSIPGKMQNLTKDWQTLEKKIENQEIRWGNIEYAYFDSINPDFYVICRNQDVKNFYAEVPEPEEDFFVCFETLMDEANAKAWKKRRVKKQEKKEEEERKTRERMRAEEERQLEELQVKYMMWKTAWEDDLQAKRILTIFPHLPIAVCTCNDVSCVSRKEPGSLMACQHDVEKFFRASGMYSVAWLKKERLMWHPDRFCQRCDPDFRVELRRKATALYAVFEVLIDLEKEREGTSGTTTP